MKSPICRSNCRGRPCGPQCACAAPRRPRRLPEVKARDGRVHKGAIYRPQFAVGIVCRDEADQQALFKKLAADLDGREVKVLVI